VSDLRRFGRGEHSVAITCASGILHQPHSPPDERAARDELIDMQ
jgi:hypothetical protein